MQASSKSFSKRWTSQIRSSSGRAGPGSNPASCRLAVLRHVEEVSGNVAATCRYYGISRQCYYGWLRRFEADGLDGLKDRSQRPHRSPRAIQAEVVEKIISLRQHYHFGPAKIPVPGPLPRHHDQRLRSVADLETARTEPVAGPATLPSTQSALEAL
jgi:transposase-like protein